MPGLTRIRPQHAQVTYVFGSVASIERQDVARMNARAFTLGLEAAALQRDINEARILIDRLQHRYLNADKHNEHRLSR